MLKTKIGMINYKDMKRLKVAAYHQMKNIEAGHAGMHISVHPKEVLELINFAQCGAFINNVHLSKKEIVVLSSVLSYLKMSGSIGSLFLREADETTFKNLTNRFLDLHFPEKSA